MMSLLLVRCLVNSLSQLKYGTRGGKLGKIYGYLLD